MRLIEKYQDNGGRYYAAKEEICIEVLDRLKNKQHEVFEPSFDWKECLTTGFTEQKVDYIHLNPCKAGMVCLPEEYLHSSATYYYTGKQGVYPVITYMELADVDLR